MKRLRLLLRLAVGWFTLNGTPALAAVPPYYGIVQSTAAGTDSMYLSGKIYISASSKTTGSPTITLDGTAGSISVASLGFSTLALTGNAFSVGTSTFVVIGGKVGVLTATPATPLDVAGTAQFGLTGKSTFTADGSLITSSASVTGNRFSVGGSSFTVLGGTATVAYRMTAASFAGDGSLLSNVGGGVSLSANNSFTANNTFTASVTANSGFFLDGGIAAGWWIPIASGTVANISTLTLSGLASSTTYRLWMQTKLITGPSNVGVPYLVYNQSGGSPFSSSGFYNIQSNFAHNGSGLTTQAAAAKYCAIGYEAAQPNDINTVQTFGIDFYTLYGSSVNVDTTIWQYHGRGGAAGRPLTGDAACSYTGAAPLTDVEVFFAAINEGAGGATFSGKFVLYRLGGI